MAEVKTYKEMNDQIVGLLRLSDEPIDLYAAQYIQELRSSLKVCCNELCQRCGDYRNEHLGACDGCRWKTIRREL